MTNLVTLNHSINPDYNWNNISDVNDRTAAESAVKSYKKEWEDLRDEADTLIKRCLLYTSPSPRDGLLSRMPSSA